MIKIVHSFLVNISVSLVLMLTVVPAAFAVPITWTDWTAASAGYPGSAEGSIGTIGVRYSGEVEGSRTQTSGGTNWWTEGTPAPYTGNAVIDNAPPASDIIVVNRGFMTNTISFAVPIYDPVMAFVSIGRTNLPVSYAFDAPFTLLSEGQGWWGNGWWTQSGNTLTGYEAHGAIQFRGLVSRISWVNTPGEYWHGFTIGAPTPSSVPEPGIIALLAAGLAGLAAVRRNLR